MGIKTLLFIGEKPKRSKIKTTRKPKFFDAALLSCQSPHLFKNSPYQIIHLSDRPIHSFYLSDEDIKMTFLQHSIQIVGQKREISDKEALDAVTNFLFKEANRVTILSNFHKRKIKPKLMKGKRLPEKIT
ncbi:hypothetical protein [Neobacillus fumarioli]|uniref:hypothetical protein n=1 Tax=Neobacillus fumarioli TaxID=105229 RepID=UPI0008329BF4|nr:hypothetical protein [Neobacillus fumarioli]